MNYYDCLIENKTTGVQETISQDAWEKLHKHKTIGKSFRLIKRIPRPEAAIEAERNASKIKAEPVAKAKAPKKSTTTKTLKSNGNDSN